MRTNERTSTFAHWAALAPAAGLLLAAATLSSGCGFFSPDSCEVHGGPYEQTISETQSDCPPTLVNVVEGTYSMKVDSHYNRCGNEIGHTTRRVVEVDGYSTCTVVSQFSYLLVKGEGPEHLGASFGVTCGKETREGGDLETYHCGGDIDVEYEGPAIR